MSPVGLGLLLVPVLGGYWFLTHLHFTRYVVLRESGYHLFFRSAIAGGLLFVIARLVVIALNHHLPQIGATWKSYMSFDYSGTAAISTLLAFTMPYILNVLYGREKAERRIANKNADSIEAIILESLDRHMPVEVSLKNGKSYIGFTIEKSITARDESDIALIPIQSGYRDKNTHELKITTDYASVLMRFDQGKSEIPGLRYTDLRIIIPMSEIVSVRIFNHEIHRYFQKNHTLKESSGNGHDVVRGPDTEPQ